MNVDLTRKCIDLKYLEQSEWEMMLKQPGYISGGPSMMMLKNLAHLANVITLFLFEIFLFLITLFDLRRYASESSLVARR